MSRFQVAVDAAAASSAERPPAPRRSRLLLVEDDEDLAEVLASALVAWGFEVERQSDGAVGLERALTAEHEIVVLDLGLPGLAGQDFLRRLRRSLAVPVLVLTAQRVERVAVLADGADDLLAKPFELGDLIGRLRRLLSKDRQSPTEVG